MVLRRAEQHPILAHMHFALGCFPSIYIPMYKKYGKKKHLLIGDETEMVIEGFPRSGNTFAVVAFQYAQKRRMHIAHHLHVPAQVLEGIRRRLPVLVLIRNPIDAIKSLKIRSPRLNENYSLKEYVRFYEKIAANVDRVVVGRFEDVISDYGAVIGDVNRKFNSNFNIFDHTEDTEQRIFRAIEQINSKSGSDKLQRVAIPMDARETIKRNVRLTCQDELLRDAVDVYKTILHLSSP